MSLIETNQKRLCFIGQLLALLCFVCFVYSLWQAFANKRQRVTDQEPQVVQEINLFASGLALDNIVQMAHGTCESVCPSQAGR